MIDKNKRPRDDINGSTLLVMHGITLPFSCPIEHLHNVEEGVGRRTLKVYFQFSDILPGGVRPVIGDNFREARSPASWNLFV